MKVFIPKNVSGGLFNMSIQIGPITVSVLQLIVVAIGLGIGLGVFNTLYKNGAGRMVAALMAIPILLIFIFIAFFRYSELSLIPFIAKMIKTHFLDVTQKYQINWKKPDPISIALKKFRSTDHDKIIKRKELVIDQGKMDKLNRIIE